MNIENLDYTTYYSKEMIPDTNERFRTWGQLAGWSEMVIYEWVESNVLPTEWDAIALVESGDVSIPEEIRKSGTARKVLFELGSGSPAPWIPAVNKFDEQYSATTGTDNLDGTFTFIVNVSTFVQTGSPLQYLVDVYVNGSLLSSDSVLDGLNQIIITTKEQDVEIGRASCRERV